MTESPTDLSSPAPLPPHRSGRFLAIIGACVVAVVAATVGVTVLIASDNDAAPAAVSGAPAGDIAKAAGLPDPAPDLATANGRADLNVVVVAQQWSWTFNYTKGSSTLVEPVWESGTAAEKPTLWLVKGKSVTFDLYSPDVIHSFWPRDLLFKMDVVPGRAAQNYFTVTPTELGTFVGRCAELCGVGHARMLFNVTVVEQAAFDAHLDELRAAEQTGINAPGDYTAEISGS